jgi:predicted DNA-binding transcriptional regulator YafY
VSRTSRLFLLLDALRQHRRPVPAQKLADELQVSVRTIYRDVQTLIGLGAPVEGEAGVGYVLSPGFFLPPLMFGTDELEALVLGARWVQRHGDPALAKAAGDALSKIATASPADLRETIANTGLWAPPTSKPEPLKVDLQAIREAIRREHKLRIAYTDAGGAPTERLIWPIGLAFHDGVRTVPAWCELRQGFRIFRVDRMASLVDTGTRYPRRRPALVKAWRAEKNYGEDS